MTERTGDEILVKQTSQSCQTSIESLIEEYSDEIALLANRLLGWPGEVEDITQEVFLAAFIGLKKFRYECDIKSWLFTITINKCRSFRYKKLLSRRRLSSKHFHEIPPAADKKLLDNEAFENIRHVVKALPTKYREPVVLKYLQELETKEICNILKISANTLNVRLSRARERLKNDLKEFI